MPHLGQCQYVWNRNVIIGVNLHGDRFSQSNGKNKQFNRQCECKEFGFGITRTVFFLTSEIKNSIPRRLSIRDCTASSLRICIMLRLKFHRRPETLASLPSVRSSLRLNYSMPPQCNGSVRPPIIVCLATANMAWVQHRSFARSRKDACHFR